ncbi:MAG: bifunctional adenosylcobinamide kinase/adenosylcobinamide-phosphate guanylyltransferase [Lachnospiraceae bacterium]|nr:bifunctional adenosylcobinamide kinase/adenosylcobinamide-phosphate guanylyltransferase [Lachnospiraceae bacterium]
MILVTGGSNSGKSAYAEALLQELEGAQIRYYIATMQVWDEESRIRVEKHRKIREGKDFLTIEQPADLEQALGAMQQSGRISALLECMSNLTANEMFRETGIEPADAVAEKILRQTAALDAALDPFIVVTNNVFEDGAVYEPETMEYLRALGEINRQLAMRAKRVIEVVAGIPVMIKASYS